MKTLERVLCALCALALLIIIAVLTVDVWGSPGPEHAELLGVAFLVAATVFLVAGTVFAMIRRRRSPTPPTPRPAPDGPNAYERSIYLAEQAWQLPATYFGTWRRDAYYVPQVRGVNELVHSCSPLHNIMHAEHESFPAEMREGLWASPRFRRAVAHVLSLTTSEEAWSWAEAHMADGYWEPMARTVKRACQLGLVGLPVRYDDKFRRQYF